MHTLAPLWARGKFEPTPSSTGTEPAGWRAYWQAEAHHQGSDLTIVDQLRDADDADAGMGCSS
jgi:hypothetical protein